MEWTLVWTAFGACGQWFAAFATLGTVLYLVFQEYIKRPVIVCSFDNDKDVKTQYNTPGVDPPERPSRWLRVRLENIKGRRVAKNSRAFLIGIQRFLENGQVEDVFPNDVRQLLWEHQPPEQMGRDLLPGVVHRVDVLGAISGDRVLSVRVVPFSRINVPGKYRLRIQAAAEDAVGDEITLVVKWDGSWESLSGEIEARR
jgi:hypothetical protein